MPYRVGAPRGKEGPCLDASGVESRGLARGVVGSARVIAFGASNVAPAGAAVGGLVIAVSYAGFASPLVVLIAFVASVCCASSIAEFGRRLPSAGSLYTYNSRGLGRTGGFLTGWMMVFAYALYAPAGISLTSAYASQLIADTLHVTIDGWVLFLVILGAVVLVAYLGIRTSSSVDLVLVAGEVAIIAALAITILAKIGPAHYSVAVLSPASSPNGQLTDITDAMIYAITAFAGFEAAAALGEEARNTRRSIPASTIGVVIVAGIFYLLVVCAETFGVGRRGISGFARQPSPLGYLTSQYLVAIGAVGHRPGGHARRPRLRHRCGQRGHPGAVRYGTRAGPPGLTRPPVQPPTPAVSIGCVAVLALALGLPLTYADGGARAFAYLAGAGGLSIVLIYVCVAEVVLDVEARVVHQTLASEFEGTNLTFWR